MAVERYLGLIIAICIVTISISTASAIGSDLSDLKNLISYFEKSDMSSQDLASALANQGFDAIAKNGYTEVHLLGKIYKITPSADKPGSFETEIMIQQCPNTKMYEEDRITSQKS
jgi:hypothetical protein